MKTNRAWKKQDINLRPGLTINGKWHHQRYIIKKKLGEGAVGAVYLCEVNGKLAALKISDKGTSMTVEVNVLKSLQKVQGSRLGPYLLDVDDWVSPYGHMYSFYVMEYLKGEEMSRFIQNNGSAWVGVFMLQLLEDLGRFHQSGWIFGDLKLDNLIVVSSPTRVRFIDVGGTTQIGRAIKEYTEFYDRGYWGMGTRRAEPSYDLFAFVMVFINVFYPKRFERGGQSERILFKRIDDVKALIPYRQVLKNALTGKYLSSAEMKQEITNILYSTQKRRSVRASAKEDAHAQFLMEAGGVTIVAIGYYLFSLLL
ncbi:protein kinase domain-containing protein [Oceanobacillus chungangensis]|uniref:Serine/threonine protein kinase n=1 Tax=Oceanobacillus chungangensis TaxID=1229152 RepID=A0A3D8PMW3_9BACI|nr:serine/threonine-protein kinase [Oceanobacillus chungangensis]RDW16867.1 serine/threonine protein kinase [Oceanobacillus chungangensis]